MLGEASWDAILPREQVGTGEEPDHPRPAWQAAPPQPARRDVCLPALWGAHGDADGGGDCAGRPTLHRLRESEPARLRLEHREGRTRRGHRRRSRLEALKGVSLSAERARRTVASSTSLVAEMARDEEMLNDLAADFGTRRLRRGEWLAARDPIEARLAVNGRDLEQVAADSELDDAGFDGLTVERWDELDLHQNEPSSGLFVDRVEIAKGRPAGTSTRHGSPSSRPQRPLTVGGHPLAGAGRRNAPGAGEARRWAGGSAGPYSQRAA